MNKVIVAGRTFASIKALAEWSQTPYATLFHRIRRGVPPDEAIKKAVKQLHRGPVAAFGIQYPSLSAAARAFEKNPEHIRQRVYAGMSLEDALTAVDQRSKKTIARGQEFPSIAAVARHFGVGKMTLHSRLRAGCSIEEAVEREIQANRPMVVDGVRYGSVNAAARAFNQPYKLVYKRLRRGWDAKAAVKTPAKIGTEVVLRSVRYPTIKAAAAATGIDPGLASYRLNAGWEVETAFDPHADVENRKSIVIKGREYKTLSDAAREYNIPETTFMKRIRASWSPEQAAGLKPSPEFPKGKRPIPRAEYLERLGLVHGDDLDFSKGKFRKAQEKVQVRCKRNPSHPPFWATPNNLLRGRGCPTCSASLGEKQIARWLDQHKIEYVRQWTDPSLASTKDSRGRLRFDFYLRPSRILIEFDGQQHFEPIAFGKMTAYEARRAHEQVVQNDRLKTGWAEMKGLLLVRVKYDQNVSMTLEGSVLPMSAEGEGVKSLADRFCGSRLD